MAHLWLVEHLSDTMSLRSSCRLSLSAMCAFWRWAFALADDFAASARSSASWVSALIAPLSLQPSACH